METIHVKLDELTTMAYKCNNSRPTLNCLNFQDTSEDSNETPSKEDLDNLFGPLYEEYYETRSPEVSTNFAANTLNNEDTPSSSSIIDEENEAPQIVSLSEEPIDNEPTTLVSDDNADESVQENTAEPDENTFINPFYTPILEEDGSSLTNQDPSNMHKPIGRNIIGAKWLWKNKIDDENTVIQNKSRLVANGYYQEEGIDFEKSSAPVARLEDPDRFADPDFPNHVYRLKKSLYGLKQAPKAWYDKLSSFLIDHHFTKGDKLVSWSSKKQDCTTMSTVKAEYSANAISCNPVKHSRTKHINIPYHFIKEHVEQVTIEIYFIGKEYQLAGLFTKALPKESFEYLVHMIGMRCMTLTELDRLAKLSY
ncbi:retrovirus-related pol polyprotein from transposon TNT 1-94 [Tanacetum coccineum]